MTLLYILLGISIGWITSGVFFYFFMEYWNKKMFGKTPYVRKNKIFTDAVRKGLEDEYRNFKK